MTPSVRSGKGTTVRHKVFEAGAIFPSTSVNGQAHCIALTPFVPLSRKADAGGLWSAEAKLPPTLKLALQHSKNTARGAPLPRSGRGAGGEGEKACEPRTQ